MLNKFCNTITLLFLFGFSTVWAGDSKTVDWINKYKLKDAAINCHSIVLSDQDEVRKNPQTHELVTNRTVSIDCIYSNGSVTALTPRLPTHTGYLTSTVELESGTIDLALFEYTIIEQLVK
jgi:hypothetical protein